MRNILITISLIFILSHHLIAQTADKVSVTDTRDVNSVPNDYDKEVKFEFKRRSTIGVPGIGNFSGTMTFAPWSDNSGDKSHQLNFNEGGIYYRSGEPDNLEWDSWRQLLVTDANGKLGIGTTEPNGELHIKGTGSQDLLLENAGIGFSAENSIWADLVLARWEKNFLDLTNWGSGDDATATVFRISAHQSLGKEASLSLVRGAGDNLEFVDIYNNGYDDATNFGLRIQKRGTGSYRDFVFDQYDGTTINPIMVLKSTGNIGMGTNTPSPDFMLDVNGAIRATEIRVEAIGADFVFEEDYKLMSLKELEVFVKTQKHLPEIAPANEMEVEGLSLSEMNIKLLQKIEELTLYTIEQEKRIKELETLKEIFNEQNKKIQELEEKLNTRK